MRPKLADLAENSVSAETPKREKTEIPKLKQAKKFSAETEPKLFRFDHYAGGISLPVTTHALFAELEAKTGWQFNRFKKVGQLFGCLLGRLFGRPIAAKRYLWLWYTDLIQSTFSAYLGDLLGNTFNSIELTPRAAPCHPGCQGLARLVRLHLARLLRDAGLEGWQAAQG